MTKQQDLQDQVKVLTDENIRLTKKISYLESLLPTWALAQQNDRDILERLMADFRQDLDTRSKEIQQLSKDAEQFVQDLKTKFNIDK